MFGCMIDVVLMDMIRNPICRWRIFSIFEEFWKLIHFVHAFWEKNAESENFHLDFVINHWWVGYSSYDEPIRGHLLLFLHSLWWDAPSHVLPLTTFHYSLMRIHWTPEVISHGIASSLKSIIRDSLAQYDCNNVTFLTALSGPLCKW